MSSARKQPKKAAAGSAVIKEMQRAAALAAYELVCDKKGMNAKAQKDQMFKDYHGIGGPNKMGLLEQMLTGSNQFSGLYDRTDLVNNDDSNRDRTEPMNLVLKPSMHREFENTHMVDGTITRKLLQRATLNKPGLIAGRTLYTQAKDAERNGKKAYACAEKWFQANGNNPSGTRLEDYHQDLLDGMYADLEGIEGTDSDDDSETVSVSDDTEEETTVSNAKTGERPAGWMWHGYMAFMLFGPHVEKTYQSNLFNTKDPIVPEGGKKENGRASQRARQKQSEDMERAASMGSTRGSPFKRGATTEERSSIVMIAQGEDTSDERREEMVLFAMQSQLRDISNQITQEIELAKFDLSLDDKEGALARREKIDTLTANREKVRSDIESASSKKRKANPLIAQYLNSTVKAAPSKRKAAAEPHMSSAVVPTTAASTTGMPLAAAAAATSRTESTTQAFDDDSDEELLVPLFSSNASPDSTGAPTTQGAIMELLRRAFPTVAPKPLLCHTCQKRNGQKCKADGCLGRICVECHWDVATAEEIEYTCRWCRVVIPV